MRKLIALILIVCTYNLVYAQKYSLNATNINYTGYIKLPPTKLKLGTEAFTQQDLLNIKDITSDTSYGVALEDTTNVIKGSYTTRHDFKTEPTKMELIKVMNKYGAGIKFTGLVQASSAYTGSTNQMINERASYVLAYVTDTISVSTLYFQMHGAGSYTTDSSDFNGMAIYSISDTTATRIAITANTPTLWTATANTAANVALASSVTLVPGIYYVGFLYCYLVQTTAPYIVGSQPGMIYTDMVMVNSMKLGIFYSTVTSFPASFTISSVQTLSVLHNFIGK